MIIQEIGQVLFDWILDTDNQQKIFREQANVKEIFVLGKTKRIFK